MLKKTHLSFWVVFVLTFNFAFSAFSFHKREVQRAVGLISGLGGGTMAALSAWYAYNVRGQVADSVGFVGDTTASESALEGTIMGSMMATFLMIGGVFILSGLKGLHFSLGASVLASMFGVAALVGDSIAVGLLKSGSALDLSNGIKATALSSTALLLSITQMAASAFLLFSFSVVTAERSFVYKSS